MISTNRSKFSLGSHWLWMCIMHQRPTETWHVWNITAQVKTSHWLACCWLHSFLTLHVHTCVHVVPMLFETVSLFAALMPLRCLPDSVVTPRVIFKDRLRDTMSHPEFYPTLPREALKICHPWQQPYISWGSLCYVSGRESGFSFSYDLFTFIFFFEKAAEYLAPNVQQI